MAGEIQKIRTILIPEDGLDLEPAYTVEAVVDTEFSRTFAHMVGKREGGTVLLRCTSDGRLLVAAAGTAYEFYDIENGTGADAYTAPNTYDQTEAWYVTDLIIETHPAEVSFRNQAGLYGADKYFPVGAYSIELIHYGMRIQNRTPGSNTVYEFTIYR